jgi:DNA-binding MarR family transcriptional regulator
MDSVSTGDRSRRRRQLTKTIKDTLRAMNNQLSLLNHHVSMRVDLKDVDLDCLDLIDRHGPLSPSAVAKRAGLHPATVTGILDRLQRGRWITRERDPDGPDRRAVTVRVVRDRGGELYRLYGGMNASLDDICAGYTDTQLAVVADFLKRTTEAGRTATDDLS